jgi:hypothetical protein
VQELVVELYGERLSFNSLAVPYTLTIATRQQLPTLKYAYALSTVS